MKNKETVEEAAEQFEYTDGVYGFKQGAKWQQERSYSEEEVIKLVSDWNYYQSYDDTKTRVKFKDWFEQFKNK
jgi:hypothetical protein